MTVQFAPSTKIKVDAPRKSADNDHNRLFNQKLPFNKIIQKKDNNTAADIIHSIDPLEILKVLRSGNFEPLFKISLIANYIQSRVGYWDVLFNSTPDCALSACVFSAQEDFSPIPHRRIRGTSKFLNFKLPVSRVHICDLREGDKLGIGINDHTSRLTYVLIYEISSLSSTSSPTNNNPDVPVMVPVLNVRLGHVFCFNRDGEGDVYNMEEDIAFDSETGMAFVKAVNDAIHDIPSAYPWKPHFLSTRAEEHAAGDLAEIVSQAVDVSFDVFDDMCRRVYSAERYRRKNTRYRQTTQTDPSRDPLPSITVIRQDDTFVIQFESTRDLPCHTVRFSADEIGVREKCETFLLNKDNNTDPFYGPVSLDEATFGPSATVRRLTINY